MQPIKSTEIETYVEPKILIGTKSESADIEFRCNNSNESRTSNVSSGFGSDFDAFSPLKTMTSCNNSPATSDYLEACPLPATPMKNTHKNTMKNCPLQFKSKKLFGMSKVRQQQRTPLKSCVSSSQTGAPTSITSIPSSPLPLPQTTIPECVKKLRKDTPYKVHLLRDSGIADSFHRLSLRQSLVSLHI